MGKEVIVSQPISATCEHLIDKDDFISIMLIMLMAIVAIFWMLWVMIKIFILSRFT